MAAKGLDRLKRQIAALPRLQVEAAARSLEQGAAELANAISRAVPARTGDLAASVGYAPLGQAPETSATQAFRGSNTERAGVLGEAGLGFEVFAGNNVAFYARWVEFGTAPSVAGERMGARNSDVNQSKSLGRLSYRTHPGTPAQPFFFPTVRAHKKRLKSRVVRNANKAAKAAASIR